MNDFQNEAYELQIAFHSHVNENTASGSMLRFWLDESTADTWRHNRMYEFAFLFAGDCDASWLTVGDGRFGLDSIALKKRGIKNVLASDIADARLKAAKELGLIETYAVENAEKMSFADGQFDYVLCKEAFHHFPRPFVALYEMLRVAKKAVILIEPSDHRLSVLGRTFYALKRLLGRARHIDQGRYEESGNYVYSISERETEKLCLGLDLPHLFLKGLNDVYIQGGEYVPAKWTFPLFVRMRLSIMALDCLCVLRLFQPTRLSACLFKTEPSDLLQRNFLEAGWKRVDLPRNPYRRQNT